MFESYSEITIGRILCVLLAPFIMLYRLLNVIYCLIINSYYKNTRFDKYSEVALPADDVFQSDEWQSFQFMETTFSDLPDFKTMRSRMNRWSNDYFGTDANIVITKKTSTEFVNRLMRSKPSDVIKGASHLLVYCPMNNTLIGFCDHYYCDGHVLRWYICCAFWDDNTVMRYSDFPKYHYIPLLGDSMVANLAGRQISDCLLYPSQLSGVADHTRVMTQMFDSSGVGRKWDRWCTFTRSTLHMFDSMPDVEYLRFGITVGFDTDQVFANNRIGIIIVRIQRPTGKYDERFNDVAEQYKEQCTNNYTDAHTSYDILRHFSSAALRSAGRKTIDAIFTTLYSQDELPMMIRGAGGFAGPKPDGEFLYINVVTCGNSSMITYVSNLKQINYDLLESYGLEEKYSFPHDAATMSVATRSMAYDSE